MIQVLFSRIEIYQTAHEPENTTEVSMMENLKPAIVIVFGMSLYLSFQHALIGASWIYVCHGAKGNCTWRQEKNNNGTDAPVRSDCRYPCSPTAHYRIDVERKELVVRLGKSERTIGYTVFLIDPFRGGMSIYEKREIIRADPVAVFNNILEGRYNVVVRCRYDDNMQSIRSNSCYNLIQMQPVIVSFGTPHGTDLRNNTTHRPETFSGGLVLVILSAVIVTLALGSIGYKIFKRQTMRPYTGVERNGDTGELNNVLLQSEVAESPLKILIVSEYGKDFSTCFGRFIETNPRFQVTSLDTNIESARVNLSKWINDSIESCDVAIVLLTNALTNRLEQYSSRASTTGCGCALDDIPLDILTNLQTHHIFDTTKPTILLARVVDRENIPPPNSVWKNELLTSCVTYTLTCRTETGVQLHSHFEKLWTFLHEKINEEIENYGKTVYEAGPFLESVRREFGCQRQRQILQI